MSDRRVLAVALALSGTGLVAQERVRDAPAAQVSEATIADPSNVISEDIEMLARAYATGIVATVEALEGARVAPLAPQGVSGGHGPVGAFIGYRVRVQAVVYDRRGSRAPLEPGDVIVVEDLVGIGGYKRFRAGEVRVRPADECLFTLTHRPDGRWLLAPWPHQFRKVNGGGARVDARPIVGGFEPALRSSGLLMRDGDASERMDWQRLIAAFETADAALRARR